jgi:hypothetical protein
MTTKVTFSINGVPIPINIDEYRYQRNASGSYTILTMKNYTDKCAPEFLGETIGEYKSSQDMVDIISRFSQDYEVAKYYVNKINTSFNGPSSNVIYCSIVFEGPKASKAHVYAYFRIYTRDGSEAEDIYRLLSIESGKSVKPENINQASKNGDLVGVKHLVENGTKATLKTINEASTGNHRAIVEYLVSKGVKPNHETLVLAIKSGSTDVVEYLTSIGIKPTENDVKDASSNGYIEMAKTLGIAFLGVGILATTALGSSFVGFEEGYQRGYNKGYGQGSYDYKPALFTILEFAGL